MRSKDKQVEAQLQGNTEQSSDERVAETKDLLRRANVEAENFLCLASDVKWPFGKDYLRETVLLLAKAVQINHTANDAWARGMLEGRNTDREAYNRLGTTCDDLRGALILALKENEQSESGSINPNRILWRSYAEAAIKRAKKGKP